MSLAVPLRSAGCHTASSSETNNDEASSNKTTPSSHKCYEAATKTKTKESKCDETHMPSDNTSSCDTNVTHTWSWTMISSND